MMLACRSETVLGIWISFAQGLQAELYEKLLQVGSLIVGRLLGGGEPKTGMLVLQRYLSSAKSEMVVGAQGCPSQTRAYRVC
jgi:hypothetical protein